MSLLTSAGPTTTPHVEGARIEPVIKVCGQDEQVANKQLPRSVPSWNPHNYLTELFGDELLAEMPTIEITSGSTDYLDLVESDDFVDQNDNPVCMAKGIDPFGRHFVTMGLQVDYKDGDENNAENKSEYYIYTLFRRYTDTNSGWVLCKSHCSKSRDFIIGSLLKCSTVVYDETIVILKKMLDDFQNRNTGIELSMEQWDGTKKDYVQKVCNVKFYCPREINTVTI